MIDSVQQTVDMMNYKQNFLIRVPDQWTQPEYYLGQSVNYYVGQLVFQGQITGIRYLPKNSEAAFDFNNEPWAYIVIRDKDPDNAVIVAQSEILPFTDEQLQQKIKSQISFYTSKITALTEQLKERNVS